MTHAFSRELKHVASAWESQARTNFLAEVGKLCANAPGEISQLLSGLGLTNPLRSKEEVLAHILRHAAEVKPGAGDPFVAFDALVDAWEEFAEASEQIHLSKKTSDVSA